MNRKYIKMLFVFFIGLVLSGQYLFSQKIIPLIKANSAMVDIRDAGVLKKSYWRISPQLKPDIYTTSNKNSKVTFYTDLDSISFTVNPSGKYQFVILLNGKDSALTEIIYIPSYRETLQRASKYNLNDNRSLPKFTYQEPNDVNLQRLRKHFNLDSIAGKASEVVQVLNLMHWLHNLVPHDGEHGNPEIQNAESMIKVCQKEKRGLNCRGMAMTLNECYLSLGFKSRYVTCLPKDSLKIDNDCHVINTVYLKSLGKWIWIDPSFNTYVMDEKGVPLSIEEVRQRIIDDKPLVLNPEGNWNNQKPVVKEEYLYNYMAKNLYILECRAVSEYDSETHYTDKALEAKKSSDYIILLPLDYYVQKPDKIGNRYITNNPELFWAKP